MKEFEFEYDDNKFKGKLFLICFLLFILLLFGILFLTKLNFIIAMLISMGIPYFTFKFYQKKVMKIGFAKINAEKINFKLGAIEKEIFFNEIQNYSINFQNGTALSFKLNNGKRFGIISNIFFSNTIGFSKFCSHFENEILRFKGQEDIAQIRKKSFFEKPWVYPIMVIFTIIVVILAIIAIYKGVNFNAPFIGAVGSLGSAWSMYFNTKRNMNENKQVNLK
jgi:peptidoglycan/LPS O-acetylase OafA/YrhL